MPTIAELQQQVDRIWFASFHTELADTLTQQLRQHALVGVQAALEAALREELTAYREHARTAAMASGSPPMLRRSGSSHRRVLTTFGLIPELHVPKLRSGNAARPWHILTRSQLAMHPVLDQALYLYTLGLSLRDLQEALYLIFGHVLSREAVNRVTRAAQTPMDGRRQLLHYQAAAAEDTAAWTALFVALRARGLDPAGVRMVVSDGSSGLPAALAQELPTAQQQRWVVHRVRGLTRALCYHELPTLHPTTQDPLPDEAARRFRRQQVTTDAHVIF